MTPQQQEAWEQFVTLTRSRRMHAQDAVDRQTNRVAQMQAANKAGLVRQAQGWLTSAERQLAEIDAILAADAEITQMRGQEG